MKTGKQINNLETEHFHLEGRQQFIYMTPETKQNQTKNIVKCNVNIRAEICKIIFVAHTRACSCACTYTRTHLK